MLIGGGALQKAVALVVPTIPGIRSDGLHYLKFRIGAGSASVHGLAGFDMLAAAAAENFRFAGANREFGGPVVMHHDAIRAGTQRMQSHAGGIHFRLRLSLTQHTQRYRPRPYLHLEI